MFDQVYTQEDLETVKLIAQQVHKGQLYGSQDYYKYHVEGVAKLCGQLFKEDSLSRKVILLALLHDAVEDSEHPAKTLEGIRTEVGEEMVELVQYISRLSGETYATYMQKIRGSCIEVLMVKYADSYFNLQQCIADHNFVFAEKYLKNLKNLKDLVEEVLK